MENKELLHYLQRLPQLDIEAFLQAPPEPRTVRFNTLRVQSVRTLLSKYTEKGFAFRALPFTNEGFLLDKEPFSLGRTVDYFRGCITYQGAASQMPVLALAPQPGERILDMAASPGSKSTQIAALMQNRGALVINDVNRDRLQALNANVSRLGVTNGAIYNLPGERLGRLMPEFFDGILLDTPCSGLGTLSTHPEIWGWWKPERLEKLTHVQKQLLVSAVKALKAGGRLVYSTCSIAPEENEAIIEWALHHYPLEVEQIDRVGMELFDPGWTIKGKACLNRTRRIWPHRHKMEGFFIARLRKTDQYYNYHDTAPPHRDDILTHDAPEIRPILASISESWGIDEQVWHNFRYRRTSKRLWITTIETSTLPQERFMNAGLFFALERRPHWKLTHHALHLLGNHITRRRIDLHTDHMRILLQTGRLEEKSLPRGYYALNFEGKPLLTVFKEDGFLRLRMPMEMDIFL